MARIVIPGHPHHVTQRGVRRMEIFLGPDDYRAYLELLGEWCGKAGTEVWAYCLMPNHVHLILVPRDADGLRAGLGETHRRYARAINRREDWQGHLWQERFHSFPMEEDYLLACACHVELNPVRAKLAKRPEDWRWSSAGAHLSGEADGMTKIEPLLTRAPDWQGLLQGGLEQDRLEEIRRHVRSGHPLGSARYFTGLKRLLGRDLQPRAVGRPKKPK